MAEQHFIGIDIGGTKLSGGLVDVAGRLSQQHKYPTPDQSGSAPVADLIERIVGELCAAAAVPRDRLLGIGVGIPGVVDPVSGHIAVTVNVGLTGFNLKTELKKRLGIHVAVGNDVNLGVLGEQWLGAARGAENVVGLFPGTGIGGGVITRGQLLIGQNGAAMEIGHFIVDPDGPLCSCGNKGCLEAFIGRWAIERDIRQAVQNGAETVLTELTKGDLKKIKSKLLREALVRQDPLVTGIMTRVAKWLGTACISLRHTFDPELIVLGGGVIEACGDFLVPEIKAVYGRDRFFDKLAECRIVPSLLGDDAILLGGVALVRQELHLDTGETADIYPELPLPENGRITVKNKTYAGGFYVRADGKIKKRKKDSMELFGTYQKVGSREIKAICKKRPEVLYLATAPASRLELTDEARQYLQRHGIEHELGALSEAIGEYNASQKRKAILVHLGN